MLGTLVSLMTVLVVSLGSALGECPSGFIQHSTSCYGFMRQTAKWLDAKAHCKTLGADLAIVKSADVNKFLVDQALRIDAPGAAVARGYYLDGTDIAKEGEWSWASTGETVSYTNWGPGEPNNVHIENCLVLYIFTQYKWNNYPCALAANYICEKNVNGEVVIG